MRLEKRLIALLVSDLTGRLETHHTQLFARLAR